MGPGPGLLALALLLTAGCGAPGPAPAPAAAPDRGANPLVLEAAPGETVGGRFRSHAQGTFVEVGLKEVAAGGPEVDVTPEALEGGRARFTVGGYWTPCTK